MESSRRSFERSREQPGLKKPRLAEEIISDRGRPFGQRLAAPSAAAAVSRYRSVDIDRDLESIDSVRGTYPQQQDELVIRYKTALAELTINSKPIITNLTIIAGENLQHAKAIAAIICSNILEVPNEQKLPSLYLLDSIVKNIGRDYIKYFAGRLPEVFCKVYAQVEPSMHTSMRHLFGTWKTVFPQNSLQMIEKELGIPSTVNGSSSNSASARPDSQSHRPPQSIHVNPKYLEARQRNQQTTQVKSTVDDISEVAHDSSEILDRIPGAGSGTLLLGHPTKLLDPRREAFGRPAPVKKINPVYDDIEFNSDLPRRPNIGMGRVLDQDLEKLWHDDSVTRAISVQRNGFDDKPGIKSFPPSKSSQNDVQLKASGNISSRSSSTGMNRNWKQSDEEEYRWDDIKPGFTNDHEMAGQGKFHWMTDDTDERGIKAREASADMLMVEQNDGEDHMSLQKMGQHSSYLESLPKSRTSLSSRTGSSQSAALPLFQPPIMGTLQTEVKANYKPLTSRYSSEVLLGTATEQNFPHAQNPHSDLRNSQTPSLLNKMPLRPQPPPKGQLPKTQPYVPSGHKQLPPSGKTTKSNLKGNLSSDSSKHLSSKSSGLDSSSILLDSIMKSTAVPPLSHDETSSGTNLLEGMVEEEDIPIDNLSPPPPADVSSVKTSNPNRVSSLLGSLVAKGLISASKKKDPKKVESETIASSSKKKDSQKIASESIPFDTKDEASLKPITTDQSDSEELKALIGYEFKPAVIREPNSNVISELVLLDDDFHHPCLICGLRVKFREQLDKHMECHALRSQELNVLVKSSRRWYGNVDDWVAENSAFPYVHECIVVNTGPESEDCDEMVPADESRCVCVLCGDGFEDVYSEGRGEWMFKGAVYMSISSSDEGKIVTSSREADFSAEGLIVHPECITESTIEDLELK